MRRRLVAAALGLALLAAIPGCGDDGGPRLEPVTPGTGPGIANPASVYCVEQGGTVEIVTDEAGNQTGICVLPDGTRIDEWEFYRQQHPGN